MKTLTTLTCAMAAIGAVAFCAPNAKAQIGTTSYHSVLNFSLTVSTYSESSKSETTTSKITKYHATNKEVLEALEDGNFNAPTFPTKAKLVIGWDWNGDVLVTDKTGTNVFYDATTGYTVVDGAEGIYSSLSYEPDSDEGAVSGSYSDDSDAANLTGYMDGKFKFRDYDDGTVFDLEAKNASSTEHFTQNVNSDGDATTWSDSETMKIGDQGNQTFEEATYSTLKGTITATGSGKGDAEEYLPYFGNY